MTDCGPYRHLSVEITDGVATVTIDRPDVLNALDTATVFDLERAFAELDLHADVDVVIVTGAGSRSFSSGADTSEYRDDSSDTDDGGADRDYHEKRARCTFEMATRAREINPTTIARIEGYCLGGGLILAMYCDLRVATASAEFGIPTTQIGQIPGGGATYRLVELVGESAAKELVLTGDRIDGDHAQSIGLVNRVTTAEMIDNVVAGLVDSLQDGGVNARAAAKQSINAAVESDDREAAFDEGFERWWSQYDSEERRRLAAERIED